MEIKTIDEAKKYLAGLDRIIVPKEYTYFLHCAAFELAEHAINPYNKSWTELPLKGFTVKREMSFVEKKDRIRSALDYGGLERAMTSYAKHKTAKPFQIRVIMPRMRLNEEEIKRLKLTKSDLDLIYKEYMGLFYDGRHPKLAGGEVIHIFATSIIDEVTLTNEDIFYGIRQQDLIRYAEIVSEELAKQKEILPENIPNKKEDYYNWDDRMTFSLPKNKNNQRYYVKRVYKAEDGKIRIEPTLFEQEYLMELNDKKLTDKSHKL